MAKPTPYSNNTTDNTTRRANIPAVIAFDGYTYYHRQNDPDDTTNTIVIENATGTKTEGAKANNMLIDALTTYCNQRNASIWIKEDFKPAVALFRANLKG